MPSVSVFFLLPFEISPLVFTFTPLVHVTLSFISSQLPFFITIIFPSFIAITPSFIAALLIDEVSVAAGADADVVSVLMAVLVSVVDAVLESVELVFEELLLQAAIKHVAAKMEISFFIVFNFW